jgi:hypothetical protein
VKAWQAADFRQPVSKTDSAPEKARRIGIRRAHLRATPNFQVLCRLGPAPAGLEDGNAGAGAECPGRLVVFRSHKTSPGVVRNLRPRDGLFPPHVCAHAGMASYHNSQCVHIQRIDADEATNPHLLSTLDNQSQPASISS